MYLPPPPPPPPPSLLFLSSIVNNKLMKRQHCPEHSPRYKKKNKRPTNQTNPNKLVTRRAMCRSSASLLSIFWRVGHGLPADVFCPPHGRLRVDGDCSSGLPARGHVTIGPVDLRARGSPGEFVQPVHVPVLANLRLYSFRRIRRKSRTMDTW